MNFFLGAGVQGDTLIFPFDAALQLDKRERIPCCVLHAWQLYHPINYGPSFKIKQVIFCYQDTNITFLLFISELFFLLLDILEVDGTGAQRQSMFLPQGPLQGMV